MNKLKEYIGVVGVLCFFAASFYWGGNWFTGSAAPVNFEERFTEVSEEREQQMKQARNQATTSRTASEIMNESLSSLDGNVAKASANRKLTSASAGFLSAYWANGSVRSEYCESIGVSMGGYITQFKEMNDDVLVVAKASTKQYLKESGQKLTLVGMFEKVAKMHKPAVEQDMIDSAYRLGKSTEQLCRDMENDPVMAVASLSFSRMNPMSYRILMEGGSKYE